MYLPRKHVEVEQAKELQYIIENSYSNSFWELFLKNNILVHAYIWCICHF